jgi:hypothetical protein
MSDHDLSLPASGASETEVCVLMQRYMAVSADLTPEQRQLLDRHVQSCEHCQRAQLVMERVAVLVGGMESSEPSSRVDLAVQAAIARAKQARSNHVQPIELPVAPKRRPREGSFLAWLGAAAAIFLLVLGSWLAASLWQTPTQSLELPADLSWDRYVLYYTQTLYDSKGHPYQIKTYQKLADGSLHVETAMDGKFDVVVMRGDGDQKTLGLDMMNHVAQWDADEWLAKEAPFRLARLRQELRNGTSVYLGKDRFQGQEVYRIRDTNSLVLLLNMQYQPVNVLSIAGKPLYDILQVQDIGQVQASMWDMSMPRGFVMGQLPKKENML